MSDAPMVVMPWHVIEPGMLIITDSEEVAERYQRMLSVPPLRFQHLTNGETGTPNLIKVVCEFRPAYILVDSHDRDPDVILWSEIIAAGPDAFRKAIMEETTLPSSVWFAKLLYSMRAGNQFYQGGYNSSFGVGLLIDITDQTLWLNDAILHDLDLNITLPRTEEKQGLDAFLLAVIAESLKITVHPT